MSLSVAKKISYASASFSAALVQQFFQSRAQFFYITEMKVSPLTFAGALAIWAVWNAINDPLVGWLMDKHPTRWGRRLPWMVIFWIPFVISFGLIWSPPVGWIGDEVRLFWWLLCVLIIFDTAYTVVILGWAALFPEIYPKARDRNLIAGVRQVFSLLAFVCALVLPPFFIQDGNVISYREFGWFLAMLSFINLGMAFYGSQEDREGSSDKASTQITFIKSLRIALRSKNFRVFLVINLVVYFSYGQVLAMLPFFRKFVLQQPISFESDVYTVALAVMLLSLILWVRLANRLDPRTLLMIAIVLFQVCAFILWFIDSTILTIVLIGILGLSLAGMLMVVDLILADVVDEEYMTNQTKQEGVFYGINGLFIRFAFLLQAISLAAISQLTGFNEDLDQQAIQAQFGIKVQFILLPFLALLLGGYAIVTQYSLKGEYLEKVHDFRLDHNG